MELKENERIDDLQLNNLKIIQNSKWFCFGIDSILLSEFARAIHKNSKILDLGTGTGILAILSSYKIEGSKIVRSRSTKRSCRHGKKKCKIK